MTEPSVQTQLTSQLIFGSTHQQGASFSPEECKTLLAVLEAQPQPTSPNKKLSTELKRHAAALALTLGRAGNRLDKPQIWYDLASLLEQTADALSEHPVVGAQPAQPDELRRAAYDLAMQGLQSTRYHGDVEFKEAVDAILALVPIPGPS